MMELEEGQFDFEWLDKVVGFVDKYGLKVIMCIFMLMFFVWFIEKYLEILMVNDQGLMQYYGSCLYVFYNYLMYCYYIECIVWKLVECYGQDECIWGWQVDNELYYGVLYDYFEGYEWVFQDWLWEKYGSIDSLNVVWGVVFWS